MWLRGEKEEIKLGEWEGYRVFCCCGFETGSPILQASQASDVVENNTECLDP